MPAYNAGRYIDQAIDSVLAQSLQDWELIVVNDGSTDDTCERLGNITDVRVRVLHQPNGGVSVARNTALKMARGALLTFLDADDSIPADSLLNRVRILEQNPNIDIVDGRIAIMDISLSKKIREREPGEPGPYLQRLMRLDSSVFFGVAVMVRRDAIGQTLFSTGLTHCEDLLFLLQAADKKNWQYDAIDEVVYCYRTGDSSSAMSNLDGLEDGYFRLFQAAGELNDAHDSDIEFLYRRIRRILFRSWIRRRRPIRAWNAWRTLNALRQR